MKEHLNDAVTFAETIINIDNHDKKIIYQSRKSLRFNQEQTWVKKGSEYDIAKVCERIGIFLLNLLGRQYDTKHIGLIETMDCQFLRTVVVPKCKRLRNNYKKYVRTMVWTYLYSVT